MSRYVLRLEGRVRELERERVSLGNSATVETRVPASDEWTHTSVSTGFSFVIVEHCVEVRILIKLMSRLISISEPRSSLLKMALLLQLLLHETPPKHSIIEMIKMVMTHQSNGPLSQGVTTIQTSPTAPFTSMGTSITVRKYHPGRRAPVVKMPLMV